METVDLSAEIRLLLLACSLDTSAKKKKTIAVFLQQEMLNWQRVIELAEQNRVMPLLHRMLQQQPAVPVQTSDYIRQYCQHRTVDTLLKLNEYERVSKLLTQHGIEHLALKGVYLAKQGYPDSSLRPLGDVDLIVAEENLYKAIQLLTGQGGYTLGPRFQSYQQLPEWVMLDHLYEVSLFRQHHQNRFEVDLHWRLICLLRRIAFVQLSDLINPPDRLLENQAFLLTLHHGVANGWERIGYINDLYFLLARTDLDWHWLQKRISDYRLDTTFLIGVYWCQRVWNLPVPASVQEQLSHKSVQHLAELAAKSWNNKPRSFRNLLVTFVSGQPGLQRKLRIGATYVQDFTFRSSLLQFGHGWFYLPKKWGFLMVLPRAIQALLRR